MLRLKASPDGADRGLEFVSPLRRKSGTVCRLRKLPLLLTLCLSCTSCQLGTRSQTPAPHRNSRNAAAADGVGFTRGIGKLYEPRAGAMEVMISRVQAFKRHARQEAASRPHSKSGGAGRLWSKDQVPSRLSSQRTVGPMRPKLVGAPNRSRCGAGGGRMRFAPQLPLSAFHF
jgi:hypothetical protein